MFESNYYCLVAGLKEYSLDAETKGFDSGEIIEEILGELSSKDRGYVRLLYTYYDCENLVAAKNGRTTHNKLGNLTADEIVEELKNPTLLPCSIAQVIEAYANPEGEAAENVDLGQSFHNSLFEAYYRECAASRCSFVRSWGEFDRTMRNVSAAVMAREADLPIENVVVGGGDVCEQLQRSSAADFGLRGELPYIDSLISAMNDETNLLEKEHKIDLIRWNESSLLTPFDYFNVNAILSYLVKVNIVARWCELDGERGRKMFEKLLAELDGKELINK